MTRKRKRNKPSPIDGRYWAGPRRSEEEELAQQLLGMGALPDVVMGTIADKFKLPNLTAEGIVRRAVAAQARALALTPARPPRPTGRPEGR